MSHEGEMIFYNEVAHCKTEEEVRDFMHYRGRSAVITDRVVALWLEKHCCTDHENDLNEVQKETKVITKPEKVKKVKKNKNKWT